MSNNHNIHTVLYPEYNVLKINDSDGNTKNDLLKIIAYYVNNYNNCNLISLDINGITYNYHLNHDNEKFKYLHINTTKIKNINYQK